MQFVHRKHSEIYFVSRQVSSSVAISDAEGKQLWSSLKVAQRPLEYPHSHWSALKIEVFTAGS